MEQGRGVELSGAEAEGELGELGEAVLVLIEREAAKVAGCWEAIQPA